VKFDAPALVQAALHRAAAASDFPGFIGQRLINAITLRTQKGGIDSCLDEDLADGIGAPLRQLHISLRFTRIVREAAPFQQAIVSAVKRIRSKTAVHFPGTARLFVTRPSFGQVAIPFASVR
jgi:hypothetical protein